MILYFRYQRPGRGNISSCLAALPYQRSNYMVCDGLMFIMRQLLHCDGSGDVIPWSVYYQWSLQTYNQRYYDPLALAETAS